MDLSPSLVTALTIDLVVILVFVGVVFPAVWSRRADRRCAASRVLDSILLTTAKVVTVFRYHPGM